MRWSFTWPRRLPLVASRVTEAAVHHYFANQAEVKLRELRLLLRRGRTSLIIALLFLAACFGLGDVAPAGDFSP